MIEAGDYERRWRTNLCIIRGFKGKRIQWALHTACGSLIPRRGQHILWRNAITQVFLLHDSGILALSPARASVRHLGFLLWWPEAAGWCWSLWPEALHRPEAMAIVWPRADTGNSAIHLPYTAINHPHLKSMRCRGLVTEAPRGKRYRPLAGRRKYPQRAATTTTKALQICRQITSQ